MTPPSIGSEKLITASASLKWEDIKEFLQEGKLPSDAKEARKVKNRAAWFTLLDGVLYKIGFSEPLLK